mgnify:CR=1 FL=1
MAAIYALVEKVLPGCVGNVVSSVENFDSVVLVRSLRWFLNLHALVLVFLVRL